MLKKYVNGLLPVSSIRYPDLFIQIKAMLFPAGISLCSRDKDPTQVLVHPLTIKINLLNNQISKTKLAYSL